LLWLLTVLPAAIACFIRQQWMYFWFGWLTLGVLWYIGALARKPGEDAYEPRQVAIVLAAVAAAFVALGLFGARPSAVLGVSGGSLQNSVGNDFILQIWSECEQEGEHWICKRWDGGASSGVPYRVKVNDVGCWQAVSDYVREEGRPKRVSGCVTLYDFVLG
jgi:hypothetical protein